MQIIYHKSTKLTIAQKFFIERSIELLFRGTMDSYRVRVRNPKTIMTELRDTILAFERNQIKHFISIANSDKNKYALKNEAIDCLALQPNYLIFKTFSHSYFDILLKNLTENNYKQVKDCLSILLSENENYLDKVIAGLKTLLLKNPTDQTEQYILMGELDVTLGILFTELLEIGFSKEFLSRFIFSVFVNKLDDSVEFQSKIDDFLDRIQNTLGDYAIIFRVDTTKKVREAIQSIEKDATISDDLKEFGSLNSLPEFIKFSISAKSRCFIKCNVKTPDYLAGLKKAKAILAENLDVLNLGFADEQLNIHSRVLVVDSNNPTEAQFQESKNFLDGRYKVTKDHYQDFIDKLPILNNNPKIIQETKEKIKSAIRYLRLGNQSTEVEHKFINYWIGLEYLFSNYESNNTINRIKDYLVACHSLSYVKRNTFDFYKSIQQLNISDIEKITGYDVDPIKCLVNQDFYKSIANLFISDHPLAAYRSYCLNKHLFSDESKGTSIKQYVEKHQKNFLIHLTRIYRLRNEIIHDAATNTNNESIASNLRYYLTFILNGVIDYLSKSDKDQNNIEDYFTINEIYLGNVAHNQWKLEDLLNITTSIDFIN